MDAELRRGLSQLLRAGIRKTGQLKARVILEGEGVVLAALSCSDNQNLVDFFRAHSDRSSVCVTSQTGCPTP